MIEAYCSPDELKHALLNPAGTEEKNEQMRKWFGL
jgi:hypothetical protein